jgi:hypothetical protein
MAIIRVNKNKDFVVMSNYHFKEKEMSLKAKGLLSEMLSLPDDWDYSIAGLVAINKESKNTIVSILEELKQYGYLKITKLLPNETKSGRIEYIYDIYEKKQEPKKQGLEKQELEKQSLEFSPQYNINNKILNNKYIDNKKEKSIKRKSFIKPTIEEIQQYCLERNNGINAEAFYDFYESKNWYVGKNKMSDWKACVRTWESRNKPKKTAYEKRQEMYRRIEAEYDDSGNE